jgi:CubicO group peptidase (beta-lactamase class C family)
MSGKLVLMLLLGCFNMARAQSYFPPLLGNSWDTLSPAAYGIRQGDIDSALAFLVRNDTKAFLVLKDGKILHEHYFGSFTRDSVWYWASAGKTITAFAVGMAQEQGHLNIDSPTSNYLGTAWTNMSASQEKQINVWHQLTMTTGLDDNVTNDNCDSPACLTYLAPPGTRWAYHNAPYRLLHAVVANASAQGWQQYFNQQISLRTGINGLWVDHVLYSRPRAMARFGLLMLNRGVWNGDSLLRDSAYFNSMLRPSQQLNKSYGYLWWLNGQSNFMLPDVQVQLPGPLIPQAPAELVMGLGKNDQKLYLLPSRNIVIVRMGNGAGSEVPIVFDREFWPYLLPILPAATQAVTEKEVEYSVKVYPNPAPRSGTIQVNLPAGRYDYQWLTASGKKYSERTVLEVPSLSVPGQAGFYLLHFIERNSEKSHYTRVIVQ